MHRKRQVEDPRELLAALEQEFLGVEEETAEEDFAQWLDHRSPAM